MASKKSWRYWRNLGCFVIVVLALAAVGLVVGVSWLQADAFLHPRRHLPTETPAERGLVQNFVNEAENEEYGRRRGYTEGISVRRPWRRRGLAKALIARSFRLLKELGMEEEALGVDADNPNGALQLYKSMGFQVVKRHTTYRKPLA